MRTSPSLALYGLVATLTLATLSAQAPQATPPNRERLEFLTARLQLARNQSVKDVPALGAEALELLQMAPNPPLEIQVRLDLSWNASRAGDMAAGLEHARIARDLATRSRDQSNVAFADYHLAVAHWYQGKPEDSIATANRALAAQQSLRDHKAAATTLTLLGSAHRSRSDYDEAIACHFQALDLSQRAEDAAGIARSHNNIALIYWNLDKHARARDYLERAVASYRELRAEARLSSALSNLGLVLIEMKDPEGALPVFEEALQLQARAGNDRTRARLLGNIGFAREELGQLNEALDSLHAAVALREKLGDQWGLSRSLGSIAAIHRKEGRLGQAREFYERAVGAAKRCDAREEESVILKGLAQVQAELGLHTEAFQSLRRHLELEKDLERAETSRRIAELESKALLETQERLVQQERFARNAAIAGGSVLLLVGILGWNLFRLKRRAHQKLEALHTRLGEHAADLEAARGRIRGLEELLPICSYCKSIRDERGAWHRLESYLHERAGARMTHGICPTCVGHAAHDLN